MGISSCIPKLRRRVSKKEKERLMLRNGGILLELLLDSCDGKYNPFRIFSAKEIANATNNYHEIFQKESSLSIAMCKGSFNGRQICVKSYNCDLLFIVIPFAINEIVFASQLNNHKHILMLLGCCLETQAPVLVYEYAENGPLSDHIFKSESNNHHQQQVLPWDCRLKVAKEIADALAYLHTGFSMPIIHGNVTPRNIYLNGNYDAKLSDFSLSISIPPGEEYVETDQLREFFGSIAPEENETRQITEKSDVYSFGVLMLEILSGESIYTLSGESNWASVGVSEKDMRQACMEGAEKCIGPNNMPESLRKQVTASTELALKCSKKSPEERPTMKEAAQELRRIIKWQ